MANIPWDDHAAIFEDTASLAQLSYAIRMHFEGSLRECVRLLKGWSAEARARVYVETDDGLLHLDPPDIEDAIAADGRDRPRPRKPGIRQRPIGPQREA
jgi:hypothetical protein